MPNLKLFRPVESELRAKEVGEFLIRLQGKSAGGHSSAHQHGCRNMNA